MKVIDLWECSACGAFYADKITACDCHMDGCTTLNHYHATLTSAGNSPVIPNAYVLDELGRMTLNGVCEPRVSFGAGWNACRAEMLKAQPVSEHKWISVDDGMPENCNTVLVCSNRGIIWCAEVEDGDFYPDEFPNLPREGFEITHWMPLPAAPAQESE